MPMPFDSNTAKSLVCDWYREKAIHYFRKAIKAEQNILNLLKVNPPKIKIRQMKSRWGSCSKSGTISLNPELMKAPPSCIRYVLIHELCHLKEHSHNASFYDLLNKFLPEWKQEKQKLNLMADYRL